MENALALFDENAFAGALLSGFDHGIFQVTRDSGQASGASGIVFDLVALFHIGQAIVEQSEDSGRNFLTEAVAGAQVLINPNLHSHSSLTIEETG